MQRSSTESNNFLSLSVVCNICIKTNLLKVALLTRYHLDSSYTAVKTDLIRRITKDRPTGSSGALVLFLWDHGTPVPTYQENLLHSRPVPCSTLPPALRAGTHMPLVLMNGLSTGRPPRVSSTLCHSPPACQSRDPAPPVKALKSPFPFLSCH